MSELASVDKLRGYMLYDSGAGLSAIIDSDEIADEIEREVSENYLRCPLDADGVPIRLGDRLDSFGEQFTCEWIEYDTDNVSVGYATSNGELPPAFAPDECEHVKTRTVEDVLRAFYHDASDADAFCTVRLDDVLAKYADELRVMMEADDD